jgi:uncharacterized RDD family membrane protein YckC
MENFEDPFTLELPLHQRRETRTNVEKTTEVRWGGYFRRSLAFFIDVSVLFSLSALLVWLSYVGYTVGLAANQRTLSAGNLGGLARLLFLGWFALGAGYFILFHGMDGRTIGKWAFGLRVVGANQAPITYRQALIRWIGYFPSVLFFGLGILWIIGSREKRGWHDLLAGTWVIREADS